LFIQQNIDVLTRTITIDCTIKQLLPQMGNTKLKQMLPSEKHPRQGKHRTLLMLMTATHHHTYPHIDTIGPTPPQGRRISSGSINSSFMLHFVIPSKHDMLHAKLVQKQTSSSASAVLVLISNNQPPPPTHSLVPVHITPSIAASVEMSYLKE
jgi:hypothetical protein